MKDINIRRAGPADALTIGQIHVAASRHAYRGIYADSYLAELTPEGRAARWLEPDQGHLAKQDPAFAVFVAEQNGSMIGFADCGPADQAEPPQYGDLYAIYLAPDAQGQGAGTALFKAATAHLRASGFTGMVVTVLSRNQPACQFYEKCQGKIRPDSRKIIATGGTEAEIVTYHWPELSA